ncbi:MAG: acyl-CoA reductase [Chitinophagales bacterium]
MNLNSNIETLVAFGKELKKGSSVLQELLHKTEIENGWFTQKNMQLSIDVFCENYFHEEKLSRWLSKYDIHENSNKTVGLILAGNIPFVGMHDLLCVLMSGNNAKVKLSSKDKYFFPYMMERLEKLNKDYANKVEFVEKLEKFDAVIATGSNNSARYFNYYFGKYPHIIRKNRTSTAILSGNETDEQLHGLGKDVFWYYGLGCRNVSKIYVPEAFDLQRLFKVWEDYRDVIDNNKYKNNFDYNRAILLLNQTPHLTNDFFMLVESDKIFSPLSLLYYEFYSSKSELEEKINAIHDDLQCVVASTEGNTPFGKTQFPELTDYADHVDTMEFLQKL